MPTYKFLDTTKNEEFVEFMSITEMEDFLAKNTHIQPLVNGAPAIGDSIRLGIRKPPDSFRDVLREVKKKHSRGLTRSTINTFD